jgi:hypothetical protein
LSKRKVIKIGKSFLPLVDELNKKRDSINSFVLQIIDIPVYISYTKVDEKRSQLLIWDVGNNSRKTIPIEIDDSITHFMFLLTLIKDEYKKGYLFTNKSHLHE